jgi:hypothetical protein
VATCHSKHTTNNNLTIVIQQFIHWTVYVYVLGISRIFTQETLGCWEALSSSLPLLEQ